MGNKCQVLGIFLVFLLSDGQPHCTPYIHVSGMADSRDNICRYVGTEENVQLQVQALHNVTAGDCDTSEWPVTQTVWHLHELNSFTEITEETLQSSTGTVTSVFEDDAMEIGVYGVVVEGLVEGEQFSVEGYLAVGCEIGSSDDVSMCVVLPFFLGLDQQQFDDRPLCAETEYSKPLSGTGIVSTTTTTLPTTTTTEVPTTTTTEVPTTTTTEVPTTTTTEVPTTTTTEVPTTTTTEVPTTTTTEVPTTTTTELQTTTTQPIIHDISLSCISNCKTQANPQEEMEFLFECVDCGSTVVSYDWITAGCQGSDIVSCTESVVSNPEYSQSKYFVYKQDDLQAQDRTFAVTVLASFQDNTVSTAQYIWTFSAIPVAGRCDVSPPSGYALVTAFNVTCQGFSVSGDLQLQYTFKAKLLESSKEGVYIYKGLSDKVENVKLQSGKEQSNYTVCLEVKVAVESGASVTVTATVQILPPHLSPDGTQVIDVVKGLINVDDPSGKSPVGDLIQAGNVEEAVHLIGVISSTINVDSDQGNETLKHQRAEVRTALVESLEQVNVSSFEMVTAMTSVLNDATEEKEELTNTAQTKAADLYDNLADTLGIHQEQSTMSEVTATVGAILSGVTKILDIKTDVGKSQLRENTTQQGPTEEMEEVKNVSITLLNTVDKVSSTLMSRKVVGQNATILQTDTMTVTIERLKKESLVGKTFGDTGSAENSTANLKIPASLPGSIGESDMGVQLLHLKKNPYVWDDTASNISSNVLSIDLKDNNNSAVKLTNLTEPLRISFANNDEVQLSNATLYLHLVKTDENVTFNSNRSNLMTFNFTVVPDKLISLQLTPLVNLTSMKMHISTENKPNLSEIVDFGLVYPSENSFQEELASFELEKNLPNRTDTLFFTYNKNDSANYTGDYFVGVTVDPQDPDMLASLRLLDPACIGNNDTMSCTVEIEIPLQLETTNFGCMYWDKSLQTWTNDGCEVSPFSTRETIECLCTHMTAFAGGIFVLPNFVDPIADAALFLTFFDNPVVVTTVIIIWITYFFLIHWTLRTDLKDRERVGVISCPDNDPSHHYVYLVCVATGWWKDAGTTANVYVCMKGSKGESPKRCLSCTARRCFQVGYDDWFLLTTTKSLGNLQAVTVWHDNSGPSPHWYFSQVYVKDLQTSQCWTFIFNDWLAADRGSTLHISANIPALTEDDLKFQKRHNFMLKSSKDLRDGHLWISIFSKPVQSTFTRPQRLTCALSLLLCTMLTNIMFYGVPTDDPEDQVAGVKISLSTIIIGIESSLIMFPINMLILQMFLRIKPKPKGSTEERKLAKANFRVKKYVQQLTQGAFGDSGFTSKVLLMSSSERINSQISSQAIDGEEDEYTEAQENFYNFITNLETAHSKLVVEVEADLKDDKQENSTKFLPWWFVYITWTVVLSTCVVSSYFVMLFGLRYGYTKSIAWLVSFLTGFTQSAFITQPIKVIALAMVFTLVLKKAVPFEDFGPGVELDADEQYLQQVADKPETHIPCGEPLSIRLARQIKDRLKMEWLMNATIRDIVLYVVYLTVVMLMVHGHRNVRQVYLSTNALEDLLVNPGCVNLNKCFFLAKADSVDRFYQYLYDNALPSLADMTIADHDYATPGSNHFLVGPFRLRQLRVAKDECSLSDDWIFEKFGFAASECTNSYWIGNEDNIHYNNTWTMPLTATPTDHTPWTYQSSWDLKTMPLTGKYATYSGGGYVLQMSSDPDLHAGEITDIYNTDWIDARTRVVFLEFTLYNPNADLFSVVIILFEFTNVGSVTPSHQIFTTKLYHNSSDFGTVVLVSECLFLFFNLGFAYIEYRRYRKLGRKEYFHDFWNYIEILQLCLAFSVVGLFFQRMVSVNSILEEYRETESSDFVSFYSALFWDMTLGYVMAFLVCLVTVKFIKLLRFNKRTSVVGDTLSLSKKAILSFLFLIAVFFMAFAHFGLIAFGRIVHDYRDMYTCLMTIFNFALGVSDLPGLQSSNRILGPAFFVLFVCLVQFCFLTIFMAILNVGIIEASEMLKRRKSKFELMEYIADKMKLLMGTK